MHQSYRSGLSFGLTSGVITTLGLMVGLHAGTHSRAVVLGGIITIAVADALSDALGMHLSQESESRSSPREIWQATAATLLAKFVVALTFAVPVLLLSLPSAIGAGIVWGMVLLGALSYHLARTQNVRSLPVMLEHLVIAAAVVVMTYMLGGWISGWKP